jgi:DNA-binding MarR family transcriptional regulator
MSGLARIGQVRRLGAAVRLTSGGTALIDRLERQGLVTRARDPEDRRGVRVEATALVFRRLGPVYCRYVTELLAMMDGYGQEERRAAARHLSDAAKACDAALAAVGQGGERE